MTEQDKLWNHLLTVQISMRAALAIDKKLTERAVEDCVFTEEDEQELEQAGALVARVIKRVGKDRLSK